MKTLAAVLVETGKPLVLKEIEIPQLKPGQVLVEIGFSGVCHTQISECRGYRGKDAFLPHCLGHEGSGVVLEVAGGVTKVKSGDRVLLSWMKASGADVPGTVYRSDIGDVNAGGITTFSEHAVISENRLTVLPETISLRDAALLGCAVPTGIGAVLNTARAQAGNSVVVFGTGGIGLCAVVGASIARCNPIVAVDIQADKLEIARSMGATHCVHVNGSNPLEALKEIVPKFDIAIEATGRSQVMVQALQAVRNQGGVAVVLGNAKFGETMVINPHELNQGKQLRGSWGGDNSPDTDFPRYFEFLSMGTLNLSKLNAQIYALSNINAAIDDLESGRAVRTINRNEGNNLIVGIDFDNTVACYDDLFSNEAELRGLIPPGIPARKDTVKNYLCERGQEDLWTELQGYVYGPGIQKASPYPGLIDWLNSCKSAGIKPYIISHKTKFPYLGPKYDLHQSAREWLLQNGLLNTAITGLTENDVSFALTKIDKLRLIGEKLCSYFVDDLPEFLSEPDFPAPTKKILFDPSNSYTNSKNWHRVASWSEVMNVIAPVTAANG